MSSKLKREREKIDFGFVCAGDILIKAKPSIATYTDGTPREWQGDEEIRIYKTS